MPKSNVFDRTALFIREEGNDGKKRIKRIPWDLIGIDDIGGFFVSPMPVAVDEISDVTAVTDIYQVADMVADEGDNDINDEVIDMMFFDSEADFISRFEGTFGFYTDGDRVEKEFGYPRS